MRATKFFCGFFFATLLTLGLTNAASLPFKTVFKGESTFDRLVAEAKAHNWRALPIGERTLDGED